MGWKYRILAAVVAGLFAAVSIALAFSGGADAGYNGGRLGAEAGTSIGANCTVCHGFNVGTGRVDVLGAPVRYRPGRVYDLTVRVRAPEEDGAGFELSAEGWTVHAGTLLLTDALHTQFADPRPMRYVTHTSDGLADSVANWAAGGGGYAYPVRWQAPKGDAGPVTFFAAGNALTDPGDFTTIRYYAARRLSHYAVPGDADGDTDRDLFDFAVVQRCFHDATPFADPDCEFVDVMDDGIVDDMDVAGFVGSMTGATATRPGAFLVADPYRGGLLYDRWWAVLGVDPPAGDHPLYPVSGPQSGPTTHRCKECHGWDYKGRDGAYGIDNDERYTDIVGVYGTTLSPRELFNLLASDPAEVENGHKMRGLGMSERDIWDVVRFTFEHTLDTDNHIDETGALVGNTDDGWAWYDLTCSSCHGTDGKHLNFGDTVNPEYVGTVARRNPWEFLHKVRFGHPGSPMPSLELLGLDASIAADIGAYAQTLPE